MPVEIQALIAKPELLIAVLAVGAVLGMAIEQFLAQLRRSAWRNKTRKNRPDGNATGPWRNPGPIRPLDGADQLRLVMESAFTARPLLNKSEARVFRELESLVAARNPDWRVMAQVSLGEILGSEDTQAYSCINSKRIDLLLIDGNCRPRHAIEYQGDGHHQADAAARDAVKRRRCGARASAITRLWRVTRRPPT